MSKPTTHGRTVGVAAAVRARAGIGLSRAFDAADELAADLHRVTKKPRSVSPRHACAHPPTFPAII